MEPNAHAQDLPDPPYPFLVWQRAVSNTVLVCTSSLRCLFPCSARECFIYGRTGRMHSNTWFSTNRPTLSSARVSYLGAHAYVLPVTIRTRVVNAMPVLVIRSGRASHALCDVFCLPTEPYFVLLFSIESCFFGQNMHDVGPRTECARGDEFCVLCPAADAAP